MSDFSQHGLISTLQRLTEGQTKRLEAELESFSSSAPVTLVLPCHCGDLAGPALESILAALARCSFLSEVIIGLNGADAVHFDRARVFFARLPQRHRLVWTDGPRLRKVWSSFPATAESKAGKGLNVWAACGLIVHEKRAAVIMTMDCDVISSTEEMMARLLYAVLNPQLAYVFGKVYYSRVADRIHGRVTRLLVAPLLQALVRVSGHAPLLDFLQSFRYPLSGECAFRRELAETLDMDAGWGLDIGLLCELYRQVNPRSVCQVDGGVHYDHRHQPLLGANGGLNTVAAEVCQALFEELAREGFSLNASFLTETKQSYAREARDAISRYAALSIINGLEYDQCEEERVVEVFGGVVERVAKEFPHRPWRILLPAWGRLKSEAPGLAPALAAAVDRDNSG